MNGTPRSSAAPFHPDFRNVASVDGGSTTPSVSSKTATTPSGVVSISIQQVENNSQSTSSVSKTTALSSSSSDHLIQEQSTAIAAANKATRKGWLERLISFKFSSIFSFSFPSIFKSTATKQQEAIDAVLNAPDDAAKSIATGKLEKLTPGGNDAIKKTEAKRLIRAAYGKRALDSLESHPEAALADLEKAILYSKNKNELATQLKNFLLNTNVEEAPKEAKEKVKAEILKGNFSDGMLEDYLPHTSSLPQQPSRTSATSNQAEESPTSDSAVQAIEVNSDQEWRRPLMPKQIKDANRTMTEWGTRDGITLRGRYNAEKPSTKPKPIPASSGDKTFLENLIQKYGEIIAQNVFPPAMIMKANGKEGLTDGERREIENKAEVLSKGNQDKRSYTKEEVDRLLADSMRNRGED